MNVKRYRIGLLGGVVLSACVREGPIARIELPPPPTPAMVEEPLRPQERPQIQIVELEENPSGDKQRVTLTGTVRNFGTGPTHRLVVQVEARDGNDAVLLSTEAPLSTQDVPPGGTATFTVTLDNRPDVARYHVEAIAR